MEGLIAIHLASTLLFCVISTLVYQGPDAIKIIVGGFIFSLVPIVGCFAFVILLLVAEDYGTKLNPWAENLIKNIKQLEIINLDRLEERATHLTRDAHLWDNGELGESEEHARPSPRNKEISK